MALVADLLGTRISYCITLSLNSNSRRRSYVRLPMAQHPRGISMAAFVFLLYWHLWLLTFARACPDSLPILQVANQLGPPHRSDRRLRIPVRPAGRDPSWDRCGLVNVSMSLAQAGLFGCRQHQHCAGRLLQGNVLCSIPFLVFSNTSSSLLKFLALAKVICNNLHVLLTTPIPLKAPLPTWTSP